MNLFWLLLPLLANPHPELARIEKEAAGKPARILVPTVSSYANVNAGAELHDAPNGKVLLQVPRGLTAHLLETRFGWHRVAVLKRSSSRSCSRAGSPPRARPSSSTATRSSTGRPPTPRPAARSTRG